MQPFGGFSHNDQTLRRLDQARAALCRFRRAQPDLGDARRHGQAQRPAQGRRDSRRCRRPSPTTSGSTISSSRPGLRPKRRWRRSRDDIAYNNHDIDDGLRAGLFTRAGSRRSAAGRDRSSPRSTDRYPGARGDAADPRGDPPPDRPHGRRPDRGDAAAARRGQDPRASPTFARSARPVVAFSETMRAHDRALRALPVRAHVPPLPRQPHGVEGAAHRAASCSGCCCDEPHCLPTEWRAQTDGAGHGARRRGSSPTTSPA